MYGSNIGAGADLGVARQGAPYGSVAPTTTCTDRGGQSVSHYKAEIKRSFLPDLEHRT
jgi:hypothetical protein